MIVEIRFNTSTFFKGASVNDASFNLDSFLGSVSKMLNLVSEPFSNECICILGRSEDKGRSSGTFDWFGELTPETARGGNNCWLEKLGHFLQFDNERSRLGTFDSKLQDLRQIKCCQKVSIFGISASVKPEDIISYNQSFGELFQAASVLTGVGKNSNRAFGSWSVVSPETDYDDKFYSCVAGKLEAHAQLFWVKETECNSADEAHMSLYVALDKYRCTSENTLPTFSDQIRGGRKPARFQFKVVPYNDKFRVLCVDTGTNGSRYEFVGLEPLRSTALRQLKDAEENFLISELDLIELEGG